MILRFNAFEPHPSLRPGGEYVVLALGTSGRPMVMVHMPGDAPFDWAWWPLDMFEVVSDSLPGNWVVSHSGLGVDLMPAAWLRAGHWDDLDQPRTRDALERAWADYHRERDVILAEAGRPPGRRELPGPSCVYRPIDDMSA